jgi:hypothetical protein
MDKKTSKVKFCYKMNFRERMHYRKEKNRMKELIGYCTSCAKEIYCLDGFFNGIQSDDRKIYCFECYECNQKENPQA